MATLRYDGVTRTFPDGTRAAADVSLEVRDGEFMVLVGPSGSGKSTLLRLAAGLDAPTAGRIHIDDVDVTDAEPGERDLAMVFQAYALYPHKTVRENLDFPLRMRSAGDADARRERVEEVAGILDIGELLDRKPGQLSGGQRQRVALGRALVREPKAFLLDEPLSNLDPALRMHARAELARIHRRLQATFLYVTHDQEEAMTLGDRVAVLREGRVEQVAPPMELYRRPATRFVAGFIGSPSMNLYRCRGRRDNDGTTRLHAPGLRLEVGDAAYPRLADGAEVLLGVRPHDVVRAEGGGRERERSGAAPNGGTPSREEDEAEARPDAGGAAGAPDLTGRVELVEPRGSDLLVRLGLGDDHEVGDDHQGQGRARGAPDETGAGGEERTLVLILDPDADVEEGDEVAVRLPRDRLHLFDVEDGRRLEDGSNVPAGAEGTP